MLQRKYIAIAQTDDKTWEDCIERSKEILFSDPLRLYEYTNIKLEWDGENMTEIMEKIPVYGLLLRGWGKFDKSEWNVVDFIQTWEWDRNFLPLTFTRHYPFIRRKPF